MERQNTKSRAAFSSGEVIKFMAPGYKMDECRDFKWVSLNRAQNSKPFTFLKLKNTSRGSKVMKGGNTTTWNRCRTKNAKKITQLFQNSWNYCSGKAKHKAAYPRVPASSRRGSRRLLPPTPCSRLSVAALRLDTLAFACTRVTGGPQASRLFESIPIWHYLEENLLMCTKKIVFSFKMAHTYAKDELA